MSDRVLLFINRSSFEPAYQAATTALTAVAMGDETIIVVAFDVLRSLARGTFGQPASGEEEFESAKAHELGMPTPSAMLAQAKSLGAKIIVCDTVLRLSGISVADLGGMLDEAMGLPSIWRLSKEAKLLSF